MVKKSNNNFTIDNCLFSEVKITSNATERKLVYYGYGKAFHGSWSFGNEINRNVIIFHVKNSPPRHSENCKNNFLVLEEGPRSGISDSAAELEEMFSFNFTKSNTKLCLSLHYNDGESYLYVNKREICKFRRFCL